MNDDYKGPFQGPPPAPQWLRDHRRNNPYAASDPPLVFAPSSPGREGPTAFGSHANNNGKHISPFDTGQVRIGNDGLEVRLAQGIDMQSFMQVVAAGVEAPIGRERPKGAGPFSDQMWMSDEKWQEMFKGGLQSGLESQVLVFEVWGASRALTHQLVRSRRAGFLQQTQRATWYGDRPEVRMPESIWRLDYAVRRQWLRVYEQAWRAYQMACDAGAPYGDARYILPEGTVNYIQCTYTIREFIAMFAYRGCSMFMDEMVGVQRIMRDLVVAASPELEPYIKISCEKGTDCDKCSGTGILSNPGGYIKLDGSLVDAIPCPDCKGIGSDRKCTYQGWENVEKGCDFKWARQDNRTFLPDPRLRVGAS